jgi:NAD(P)H-dependent flavin oxidoreductase YrpB (nitropropane dioxygenase family)
VPPDFQVVCLAGGSRADPTIAIAASRASGLGVLDLTYVRNEVVALAALVRLARGSRSSCGIKLDACADRLGRVVTEQLPDAVRTAIVVPLGSRDPAPVVGALRRRGVRVLLEVTSAGEARLGEEAGVDGLVVKGCEAGGRIGEETTFILLQRILGATSLPAFAQGGSGSIRPPPATRQEQPA